MPVPQIPPIAIYAFSTISSLFAFSSVLQSNKSTYVAFAGNSFQFYNDLPRLMEKLSDGNIVQDSCLRSGSTLKSLFYKGNGMETRFHTENAMKDNGKYDIGSPNLETLFFGNETLNEEAPKWEFVVMNDRTWYPANYTTRNKSIEILREHYLPIFAELGAIPVFISTQAFLTATKGSKNLGDVPTYTARVAQGNAEYAQVLAAGLPPEQTPLIAPVGDAFLEVWEQNITLWYKLFHTDGHHPSPHGTYLQGCVLHCVLFGRPPAKDIALPRNISTLFLDARVMQPKDKDPLPRPTYEEAQALYEIAERITLH